MSPRPHEGSPVPGGGSEAPARGSRPSLGICLIAGVGVVVRDETAVGRVHVVGYFPNSNGIFAGDEVRVLGVPVGKIDAIEPQPQRVEDQLLVQRKYRVPADAKAAILSPSLVTSRAIQLTPAYTGGPVMTDHAVIPQDRTAVPVEWDDVRNQLQKLTDALQPTEPGGVSTLGAFVNTAADNLRGQGARSATRSSNCRRRFRRSAITAATSSPPSESVDPGVRPALQRRPAQATQPEFRRGDRAAGQRSRRGRPGGARCQRRGRRRPELRRRQPRRHWPDDATTWHRSPPT